jgi:2-methylisocitrate lyase-like PEP mutase family enzyme
VTPADSVQVSSVAAFRALHAAGCFVLPNPWDVGSAIFLHRIGFQALATTSAGFAFSKGLPDDVRAIPLSLMLEHVLELAAATSLPVNADFQSGFADEPERVAANVAKCVTTGVAGLSIEDATGDPATPLYETALSIERVRAARAAIDTSGIPVVLTARCEAWLLGAPDPARIALERLAAFADAGADCLYAPGVGDPATIRKIVDEVAPVPVNVLISTNNRTLTVAQLADLGVRRVSVGAALARVAWGAFMRAAKRIASEGSFEDFGEAAPFDELNGMFLKR